MSGYGQFCPVAKAMELLDERWTMLVVRELLLGSTHFNDLRRGVPKMSPALLSKRLKSLTRAGVIERAEIDGRTAYSLTQCGKELADVVESLGAWGVRWIGELGEEDLDPHLLMWDMRRTVPIEAWPRDAHDVGVPPRLGCRRRRRGGGWWSPTARPTCATSIPASRWRAPSRPDLRTLTRIWRGDVGWSHALLNGSVAVSGPAEVRRAVPSWIGQGSSAAVPRPA